MKFNIFGVSFDNYSCEEAIAIILNRITQKALPEYVVISNANHLRQLQQNPEFLAIHHNALLSIPNGVPLHWVAKLQNIPTKSRVNSISLLSGLCAEAANKNLKVFFLGGSPGAAKEAATKLKQQYLYLQIDTYCPSANFAHNLEELNLISQIIKKAAPDILFVGLKSPQQEQWTAANHQELRVPVSICIGAGFELFVQLTEQAPIWMQQIGLEWLHHLLSETRRLFQKNTLASTIIFWLLLKQRF